MRQEYTRDIDIQYYTQFKIWSNALFFIPLFMSLYNGIFMHSLVLLAVIAFSTLFHINNEQKWVFYDRFFAIVLIMYNSYLLFVSDFRQPYFFLALFFSFIAFYFLRQQKKHGYDVHHSWWHIASSSITVFCILAYIGI